MEALLRVIFYSIPILGCMLGVLLIIWGRHRVSPRMRAFFAVFALLIVLAALGDGAMTAIAEGSTSPVLFWMALLCLFTKPVHASLLWCVLQGSTLELYISFVICAVFFAGSISLGIMEPGLLPMALSRPELLQLLYRLSVLLSGGICLAVWLWAFPKRKQQEMRTGLLVLFIALLPMAVLMDFFMTDAPNLCQFIGITGVIYHMNALFTQAEKRIEDMQKSQQAELMASQIQPHFLFNALNAIYELCGRDAKAAQAAIDNFATYLRMNLRRLGSHMVPFSDEMMHVEAYLHIEQIRFGARLKVVRNLQEESFLLPPLTLQPLVENAVRHGLCQKAEGGTIYIFSRRTPEGVEIVVEDDGVGFDAAQPQDEREHVGIVNVRQRLHSMADGELHISSEPGKGTKAVIWLPL